MKKIEILLEITIPEHGPPTTQIIETILKENTPT